MKLTCSKCGMYKEPDRMFSQRYCNPCHAEYMRLTRPKHSELNPLQKKKANARSYANVYLKRGQLDRKPCFQCGYEITQFHHEDYEKPLEVQHLCRPCHLELHRKMERESEGISDNQQCQYYKQVNLEH